MQDINCKAHKVHACTFCHLIVCWSQDGLAHNNECSFAPKLLNFYSYRSMEQSLGCLAASVLCRIRVPSDRGILKPLDREHQICLLSNSMLCLQKGVYVQIQISNALHYVSCSWRYLGNFIWSRCPPPPDLTSYPCRSILILLHVVCLNALCCKWIPSTYYRNHYLRASYTEVILHPNHIESLCDVPFAS